MHRFAGRPIRAARGAVAANWSPARVPTSTDDVCIDRGAANPTVTVSADADARSLHSAEHSILTAGRLYVRGVSDVTGAALDVSGGELAILDTLTLTGTTTWSGGAIDGYGPINTSGTFVVGPTGDFTLGVPLEQHRHAPRSTRPARSRSTAR